MSELVFRGGPVDGQVCEKDVLARWVEVPLFGADAERWEKRGKYPRIRPRGFRKGLYERRGSVFQWVGVVCESRPEKTEASLSSKS